MRPLPGDDAFARPRPADNESPSAFPLTQQHSGQQQHQMTYVLADESTVDIALEHASAILQRPKEAKKTQRLESASSSSSSSALSATSSAAAADNDKDTRDVGRPCTLKTPIEALKHQDDDVLSMSSRPDSPLCIRTGGTSNPSQPMTPLMFGTPGGPMSTLSSVSSRRNSFVGSFSEDLMHSQVLSVDGCGDADKELLGPPGMMDSGSAPQLIMPSIKMPSRRPFTETGKAMGRLKVLIAGDSGVGKTSLIKAIVQSCSHIVHVDPILPSPVTLMPRTNSNPSPGRRGSRRSGSRPHASTGQITEVFASTKPYPEWWSELDDSRILKRRKSIEDVVLDRNICFIDTPGYSSAQSAMETITRVVQYVESHLHRISSNSLPDGEILNLVGGDGGVQVDAVFYMVSNHLKPVDIEYLRQLCPLTNVIMLLAQSDLLTPDQIAINKQQIEHQLQEADIKSFSFASSPERHPYAISSALGSDSDNMDASLLMSPEYVQPLIPTELAALVEQVFSPDGTSRLRHSAAKKYVQWRKAETPRPRPLELYSPLLGGSNSNSLGHSFMTQQQQQQQTATTPLASQILTAPLLGATGGSFALARVADHTQREERLAQIRLANWAGELQRSLARERARYEAVARGERAVWLTERLNECVRDGTLVPVSAAGRTDGTAAVAAAAVTGRRRRGRGRKTWGGGGGGGGGDVVGQTGTHQDPLGLLEVVADLRWRGFVILEVVGGLGVLGGLAVWVLRQYGQLNVSQWVMGEWERFWGGVR